MKKLLIFLAIAGLAYGLVQDQDFTASLPAPSGSNNNALEEAQSRQLSDVQLAGQGTVVKVLSDDREGSRHQRFILDIGTGQTVLVAHNIDLAPRVDNLNNGDTVEFYGVYEWNSKGGVVHWTHHDPAGRHTEGWIKHQGNTYR